MDRTAKWTAVLLTTARMVYVVAATVCVSTVVVGLLVALYFQYIMTKGPSQTSIPPMPPTAAPVAHTEVVDDHLKPPTNVRVSVTRATINTPLSNQDVLGYFQADTINGLAPFPEDVDILGGRDSDLFDRKEGNSRISGQGAALIPTSKFIEQVNGALRSGQTEQRYEFALVVVARDIYGVLSEITNVTFNLSYGEGAATSTPSGQGGSSVVTRNFSDLERLARDIAFIAGPENSPAYQNAYNLAVRQPASCGASQNVPSFVVNYRQLFEHARPKLTNNNLRAFFDGVCDAWKRGMAEQARIQAEAEAARNVAISANQSAQLQYQFEAAAAWTDRNLTLVVVGSALGAFLVVCLVLAFLALENHSKAMRDAIAALSEYRRREMS